MQVSHEFLKREMGERGAILDSPWGSNEKSYYVFSEIELLVFLHLEKEAGISEELGLLLQLLFLEILQSWNILRVFYLTTALRT